MLGASCARTASAASAAPRTWSSTGTGVPAKPRCWFVQIGRGFQGLIESDLGPDPNRIPVIYITVPPERESNLHWSLPLAEFLGLNHTLNPDDRNRRTADMTEPVAHVMRQAKTRLVLIDGINRIQDNEIAAAFSYFESLQDRTNVTFIFCGTGAREIVHEARYDKRRKNLPDVVKGKTYFSDLPMLWAGVIPYGNDWHERRPGLRGRPVPVRPQARHPAETLQVPAPAHRRLHRLPQRSDLPGRSGSHRNRHGDRTGSHHQAAPRRHPHRPRRQPIVPVSVRPALYRWRGAQRRKLR
ncbi:TniB family NTP-binding protein [Streptomyces sp. enrichment culture]|uniref:TniB family NTP-binding protein n=1 Tax=Streptomyces sp. enrichment culture TaxID=1795815 RepID=UPI003F5665FB